MYETTIELQHQVQNGPVALLGVWQLDLVWTSPQSSLRLDLGFLSPPIHSNWMQALLINQQRGKIVVFGVKNSCFKTSVGAKTCSHFCIKSIPHQF